MAHLLWPGEQIVLRFPVILGLQSSMCIQVTANETWRLTFQIQSSMFHLIDAAGCR